MSKKIRNFSKNNVPTNESKNTNVSLKDKESHDSTKEVDKMPEENKIQKIETNAQKPEVKAAPKEKSSKNISVSKSHITYVGIAIIFFAIGFMVNYGLVPTGQIISAPTEGNSDQFVFISPQGCKDCETLQGIAEQLASTLNIPFKTTGFDREMETPGYVLLYDGKFVTTAAFDSEATLKNQLCQLTNNEAICKDVPDAPETQEPPAPESPKSDRPVANAFVMSYCPYGTQFMKAYVPVIELLGDKADLNLNFVHYLMHGEKEMVENNNIYCIQKDQNEKFTPFLRCFLEKQDSASCMTETGIDEDIHNACLQSLEDDFDVTNAFKNSDQQYPPYPVDAVLASQYGVRGSPSFVLNGQTVQVTRSAEAIKDAICNAFNTPPAECDTQLSTAAEAPGFGPVGSGGGTDTAAGCG